MRIKAEELLELSKKLDNVRIIGVGSGDDAYDNIFVEITLFGGSITACGTNLEEALIIAWCKNKIRMKK